MMASLIPRVRAEENLEIMRNKYGEPGERQAKLLANFYDDENIGNNFLTKYKAEQAMNQEMEQ